MFAHRMVTTFALYFSHYEKWEVLMAVGVTAVSNPLISLIWKQDTVALRYSVVIGRHVFGPRYKRGALLLYDFSVAACLTQTLLF